MMMMCSSEITSLAVLVVEPVVVSLAASLVDLLGREAKIEVPKRAPDATCELVTTPEQAHFWATDTNRLLDEVDSFLLERDPEPEPLLLRVAS